tara:strand:- start:4 stop:540 length:537 start_codon:yes stop_codon:yes gene_type:complete
MSRLANKPITIDQSVKVMIDSNLMMTVSSSNKQLTHQIHSSLLPDLQENTICFSLKEGRTSDKAQLGTIYALTRNMIKGVTTGFEKKMKLVGVGYRAAMEGNTLVMQLGYSHPVKMDVPTDIKVTLEGTTIVVISGICKARVGWFASQVYNKRRPEPYKGKGVRHIDQVIMLKEGKKK